MIEEPDFDKLSEKIESGESSLQAELNKYSLALKQEWEDKQTEDSPPKDVEKYARDYFKKHAAQAAAQIVWLMGNSDSDTVSLNAAKHVLAMGIADAAKDGDPLKDLLNELSKNDKKAEVK